MQENGDKESGCICDEISSKDLSHITPVYRRALWIVVLLNVAYGVVEIVAGFFANSQALKADALDFLGDGLITFLGLLAISRSAMWRSRSALIQGIFLGALGLSVIGVTIYRVFVLNEPEAGMMGVVGAVARVSRHPGRGDWNLRPRIRGVRNYLPGQHPFHHSNLRLPIRLERTLNKLIVTPRMHGIHHSQLQHETNSNYGVVFPWWDRLHRTLGLNVPQSEIKIGVPGYSRPEDNRFINALLMPVRKQREYWPRANKPENLRNVGVTANSKTTLAE